MRQNYFIAFLFGIIFTQKINLVGSIYIGEIISVIYFAFNFFNLRYTDFEKKLIYFTFFSAILISLLNIYHHTVLDKSLKGFFAYIVFTATIIFLCRYLRKSKNFNKAIFFYIGTILGKFLSFFYINIYYFWTNPWKWGVGNSTIALVLVIALFYKKDFSKLFLIIFSIVIVYISLVYNTRSLLLVYTFSFIIYLLVYKSQKFDLKFFNKKSSFMLLPLSFFFSTLVIGFLIAKITPAQSLLADFQRMSEKNYQQGQGTFGIAVNARSELISAFYAVKDKPLFGHGSYPIDKDFKYRLKRFEFLYNFNYIRNMPNQRMLETRYTEYIPSHSFLFGAMVEGGILGSLFWIFFTYSIVKNYANYSNILPLFFHFWIIFYFYNLFFSPWGAIPRVMLSTFIVLFILYIELIKENKLIQQDRKTN